MNKCVKYVRGTGACYLELHLNKQVKVIDLMHRQEREIQDMLNVAWQWKENTYNGFPVLK